MRTCLSKLGRFRYSLHNFVGHPVMELFCLFGFNDIGEYVHDATLPLEEGEQ